LAEYSLRTKANQFKSVGLEKTQHRFSDQMEDNYLLVHVLQVFWGRSSDDFENTPLIGSPLHALPLLVNDSGESESIVSVCVCVCVTTVALSRRERQRA
jgi:hypothetical protein